MRKIKNIMNNIINILCGITIILTIFWNRFLRERKPQIFTEMVEQSFIFYCSLFFSILFFILIILQLNNILGKKKKELIIFTYIKDNSFFKKINIIYNAIRQSPIYAYEKLTKNLDLKKFIETPASYFTAYCYYPRTIVVIFYYIPQIIIAVIFVIEVCFYKQRFYFFMSLYLLIPLMIIRCIFFIIKQYSSRRINHLETFLDINKDSDYVAINLKVPEMLPITAENTLTKIINQYNVMCSLWFIYSKIYNYMEDINNVESYYNAYILFFTSICYFIGWLSIFFYFL